MERNLKTALTIGWIVTVGYAAAPASAADIHWVGYQNGCMVIRPDSASFFDGDNWFNYTVPQAADNVLFGSGFDPQANGYPHYIYFGDSCVDVVACPNTTQIPGGDAVVGNLLIQSDTWTFDFGTLRLGPCELQSDNAGALTATGLIVIGEPVQGTGVPGNAGLTLRGPGTVLNASTFVGAYSSHGTLALDTSGSRWETSGVFWIGFDGHGEVYIRSGASVHADDEINLGQGSSGAGLVGVSGSSALLTTDKAIHVGRDGTGSLVISAGASVTSAVHMTIGTFSGASGDVLVSQPGSTLVAGTLLEIGRDGVGTLMVENGAQLITGSFASIGVGSTGVGLVTVSGHASTWSVSDYITVGENGNGSMAIEDGGSVLSGRSVIAGGVGSIGDVTVQGKDSVWENAGTLDVGLEGAGSLTVLNGGLVTSGGQLEVHQLSTLRGDGTVHADIDNLGTLQPGSPIGALWIDGVFAQYPEGTTSVQLAGPSQYDQIIVFGEAFFDGTLSIERINHFEPPLGSSFYVIACNSIRSRFSVSSGLDLGNGHTLMAEYRPNGLWLTVVRYGDFNADHEIDLNDFARFREAMSGPDSQGVPPENAPGDLTLDGIIDLGDYASFQNAFKGQ